MNYALSRIIWIYAYKWRKFILPFFSFFFFWQNVLCFVLRSIYWNMYAGINLFVKRARTDLHNFLEKKFHTTRRRRMVRKKGLLSSHSQSITSYVSILVHTNVNHTVFNSNWNRHLETAQNIIFVGVIYSNTYYILPHTGIN